MNKNESKYLSTALIMNQSLIELLEKKDYEFISVKEICKKAGVNRSTFYLHYDGIDDLLCETIENINKKFLLYFDLNYNDIGAKIIKDKKDDLILITPEYLIPYLKYVKENKTVFRVSAKYPILMQSINKYNLLQEKILYPIYNRFNIPENKKKYYSAFFINGIYSIIDEWLKTDCADDIDLVMSAIIECIRP